MQKKRGLVFLSLLAVPVLVVMGQHHRQPSPSASQDSSNIKSLSAAETEGYLNGRGMGLARAAELNSYPGPMHVLELATPLELTEQQRTATQQAFERMRAAAVRLGRDIVVKERDLNNLFASSRADQTSLQRLTSEIAALQGELRLTHLRAHLEMKRVLTPTQINRYDELRGYRTAMTQSGRGE